MNAPCVSVIIPAYNCAAYIRDALESVLAQDYRNLEVIVVDDGSTDGTADAIAPLQQRIRLVRQPNSGPAAARNHALAIAQGEYIAFLDADDLWLPGKISAQMAYFARHPDIRIVYGRWQRWHGDTDGAQELMRSPNECGDDIDEAASGSIYTGMLLDSMIHSITAVAHRSVFETIGGFDESLRTGEDYDLWLRATQRFRVAKLSRTLALYRIHAASTTAAERRENNEYRVLLRALERFGKTGADGQRVDRVSLDRRLSRLCFGHGYRHYRRGDVCVAYESFRLALHHFDFRPRTLAYCVGAAARCAAIKVSSTLTGGLRES